MESGSASIGSGTKFHAKARYRELQIFHLRPIQLKTLFWQLWRTQGASNILWLEEEVFSAKTEISNLRANVSERKTLRRDNSHRIVQTSFFATIFCRVIQTETKRRFCFEKLQNLVFLKCFFFCPPKRFHSVFLRFRFFAKDFATSVRSCVVQSESLRGSMGISLQHFLLMAVFWERQRKCWDLWAFARSSQRHKWTFTFGEQKQRIYFWIRCLFYSRGHQ